MDIGRFERDVRELQTGLGIVVRNDKLDEHTLASFERLAVAAFDQARSSPIEEENFQRILVPFFQDLVRAADTLGLPLSTETERALGEFEQHGVGFTTSGSRPPARPLADAPTEHVGYTAFVDESGTGRFDDSIQPVFCMAAVVFKDPKLEAFENALSSLMAEYAIGSGYEIHTSLWLGKDDPKHLGRVPPIQLERRAAFIIEFIRLGMEYVETVHHLSMAKGVVSPEYQAAVTAKGMDAYTYTVAWFAVTLDRGLLPLTMPAGYRYRYDHHSDKKIKRILDALVAPDQKPKLKLRGIRGTAMALDSKDSRGIQLADAVAYYLSRYRDFEVKALPVRKGLERHEAVITEVYEMIRLRLLDYIGKDLYLTWSTSDLEGFTVK